VEIVELVQLTIRDRAKEVTIAANERKRRPGCHRAAHDPE
jgi:hypothetical protein